MSSAGNSIGVIGLGEMGKNLVLNIADHGVSVSVFNRSPEKTRAFMEAKVPSRPIQPAFDLPELIGSLRRPRKVLLMISAGQAVDDMIAELLPLLEPGDLLVDGGNSFFRDTERREKQLAEKDVLYLGLGISGGGTGARFGPSLMPGGSPEAYESLRPVLEVIAARVDGEPCVTYLGRGSAGHYVKMVHNGIEYGLMQLLAEAYHFLRQGLDLSNDELSRVFEEWNKNELRGYLMEITARIFLQKDALTEGRLIDHILDQAGQKGTGRWTSVDALELGIPLPTIDLAEMMRSLSGFSEERRMLQEVFKEPNRVFQGERKNLIDQLGRALYGAMILTFAQGFALLQKASGIYGYGLDLAEVARLWRGGCIIRAALLEKIVTAYRLEPDLSHLLADPLLADQLKGTHQFLRQVIKTAIDLAVPLPGLTTALLYFDSFRSAWLPANLIQAQRDYFGAHTYGRVDQPGTFHTEWEKE